MQSAYVKRGCRFAQHPRYYTNLLLLYQMYSEAAKVLLEINCGHIALSVILLAVLQELIALGLQISNRSGQIIGLTAGLPAPVPSAPSTP